MSAIYWYILSVYVHKLHILVKFYIISSYLQSALSTDRSIIWRDVQHSYSSTATAWQSKVRL